MTTLAHPQPPHEFPPPPVMEGVSWETYVRLRRELDEAGSHIRIVYDQGRMELMSPLLPVHEKWKQLIGRFIETVADERGLPLSAFGSTTWRRQDVKRGIEADQCYYVHRVDRILGKTEIDLPSDPPPDLAVEVEVTYRPRSKPAVYAALQIPELWRYDGERLDVLVLQPDGTHVASTESSIFPGLVPGQFHRFLGMYPSKPDNEIVKAFREWLRSAS